MFRSQLVIIGIGLLLSACGSQLKPLSQHSSVGERIEFRAEEASISIGLTFIVNGIRSPNGAELLFTSGDTVTVETIIANQSGFDWDPRFRIVTYLDQVTRQPNSFGAWEIGLLKSNQSTGVRANFQLFQQGLACTTGQYEVWFSLVEVATGQRYETQRVVPFRYKVCYKSTPQPVQCITTAGQRVASGYVEYVRVNDRRLEESCPDGFEGSRTRLVADAEIRACQGTSWTVVGKRFAYYSNVESDTCAPLSSAGPTLTAPPVPQPTPISSPTQPAPEPIAELPNPETCTGGSFHNMQNGWPSLSDCQRKIHEEGAIATCEMANGCWIAR